MTRAKRAAALVSCLAAAALATAVAGPAYAESGTITAPVVNDPLSHCPWHVAVSYDTSSSKPVWVSMDICQHW